MKKLVVPTEPSNNAEKYTDTFPPESATQALLHAKPLCEAMTRAGIYEPIITSLRNAHTAEIEGLLPHWAIAEKLGLYNPPTPKANEFHWTCWEGSEWSTVEDLVQDAIARNPESQFARNLVDTTITNIQRLRRKDYAPSAVPATPETVVPYPQRSEFMARAFDARLTDTIYALRQIIAGHRPPWRR